MLWNSNRWPDKLKDLPVAQIFSKAGPILSVASVWVEVGAMA